MNQAPQPSRIEAPKVTNEVLSAIYEPVISVLQSEFVVTHNTRFEGIEERESVCDAVAQDGSKFTVSNYKLMPSGNDFEQGIVTVRALNPSQHDDKMTGATGIEYILCPDAGKYTVYVRNTGLVNGKSESAPLVELTDTDDLQKLANRFAGLRAIKEA